VGKKFVTLPAETMPVRIVINRYVFGSLKARRKPCQKDCCSEDIQSSVPMSSWRRHTASWRSSSVSQVVVRGKLGRTKKAAKAMTIVTEPSMMKSHRLCKKFVSLGEERPRVP